MTHLYAHKFTTTYGASAIANGVLTDVAKTWASGLQGLKGEQLADGLRACGHNSDPWPPSLPEFVAMCKKREQNNCDHTCCYVAYGSGQKCGRHDTATDSAWVGWRCHEHRPQYKQGNTQLASHELEKMKRKLKGATT